MLRPIMTALVGTALLFACGGRDEDVEAEASGGEAIDTAAMIAEGAASGQDQPREEDPDVVPIEVNYQAVLLIPESQRLGVKLPPTGQYRASGKGFCRIDEAAGTFQVSLTDIVRGNLISFTVTRWRPAGKPYVTNMTTAPGDMGFTLANDGSRDFADKAEMAARRTRDGGTLEFDAETTGRSYALKGTAKCARLSPPIQ